MALSIKNPARTSIREDWTSTSASRSTSFTNELFVQHYRSLSPPFDGPTFSFVTGTQTLMWHLRAYPFYPENSSRDCGAFFLVAARTASVYTWTLTMTYSGDHTGCYDVMTKYLEVVINKGCEEGFPDIIREPGFGITSLKCTLHLSVGRFYNSERHIKGQASSGFLNKASNVPSPKCTDILQNLERLFEGQACSFVTGERGSGTERHPGSTVFSVCGHIWQRDG